MKIFKGKQVGPRRIMLYGHHGIGKSTWAASAPRALFINLENGIKDVNCDKTDHLKSFGEVCNVLSWLLNEPHDYKTVVIDTIDWLEQLIHREIAAAAGVASISDIDYGRGYPRAIPKWNFILENLEALDRHRRMNAILLSHSRIKKFNNPDGDSYDTYNPDLWTNSHGEGVSNMIQEWCDEVLFARFLNYTREEGKGSNKRVIGVGGKERVIQTVKTASAEAKNRIAGLPEEIPMDWSVFESYVKASYADRSTKTEEKKSEPEPAGNIAGIVNDGSSKQPAPVSEEATALVSDFAERF